MVRDGRRAADRHHRCLSPEEKMTSRTRSRWILLLITALFTAPFAIALYLYYTDWQPARTKNYGELLHPVRDLRDVRFTRADGSRFEWHHEDHVWRVLVAPPADCGTACDKLADGLRRIWVGLGKDADRVQVLWIGASPGQGCRRSGQMARSPRTCPTGRAQMLSRCTWWIPAAT
jgi:hypothetical protein